MKANEIRKMSSEDLNNKVNELKNELFNLRFRLATGQLDNPSSIKNVKRDIARVKTIIRERELEVGKEA
ncbi:MAG: 50S ribosomal protein L29 [Peptoniphilus harei]|jgi:ribosomal protein L29|uniref:Large ribosomal subunit protein uL29 n=2 Tax=Peptoniphilus TaxID=162289 RepID=E4L000_9FIRM|nr:MULTISPECIES: 50S ribosomal protein L29 [Peptoniphilus]EFR32578.1 ribosomal protein L29 [Peptoniphilus harei ACS-146-V-Sch2b]MBS6610262.1 50S ribosomal protein L29 [Peptoniphilus harei]MDK7377039.1 50S ribosomal protein L29 [Peptoniphilus harei]MDK7679354.1 50S ribosomal protein L29 [Peptoniphilus harei]MDK7754452.1 50S ribosomal protein L29 [Peptoniphilus harei]